MNKHCCPVMERNVDFDCTVHRDKFECPDALVSFTSNFNEYGLIIHDGGSSSIAIEFCPWCGAKLPESKRDLWFETLETLGFGFPSDQEIPHAFKSSQWYETIVAISALNQSQKK